MQLTLSNIPTSRQPLYLRRLAISHASSPPTNWIGESSAVKRVACHLLQPEDPWVWGPMVNGRAAQGPESRQKLGRAESQVLSVQGMEAISLVHPRVHLPTTLACPAQSQVRRDRHPTNPADIFPPGNEARVCHRNLQSLSILRLYGQLVKATGAAVRRAVTGILLATAIVGLFIAAAGTAMFRHTTLALLTGLDLEIAAMALHHCHPHLIDAAIIDCTIAQTAAGVQIGRVKGSTMLTSTVADHSQHEARK